MNENGNCIQSAFGKPDTVSSPGAVLIEPDVDMAPLDSTVGQVGGPYVIFAAR